jgi:hypothetical protein
MKNFGIERAKTIHAQAGCATQRLSAFHHAVFSD